MVALEDHMEEVVVLDVLAPTCVYTFICVEIKRTPQQSRLVCSKTWCEDDGGERWPIFFIFIVRRSIEGLRRPDFLPPSSSSLSLFRTTNPMSLWQDLLVKEFWLSYLLTYLVGWPSKTSLFCTLTFDSDLRPACHMKPSSRNHSCRARIFSRSVFLLWHLSSMEAGSKKPIAHPWSSMHGWKCTNSTKKSGWRRLAYNMVCTWKPVRLKFKIVHGWLRY